MFEHCYVTDKFSCPKSNIPVLPLWDPGHLVPNQGTIQSLITYLQTDFYLLIYIANCCVWVLLVDPLFLYLHLLGELSVYHTFSGHTHSTVLLCGEAHRWWQVSAGECELHLGSRCLRLPWSMGWGRRIICNSPRIASKVQKEKGVSFERKYSLNKHSNKLVKSISQMDDSG